MERRTDYFLFRAIRRTVSLFYPVTEIVGMEKIPLNNAIIVANHCQMNGPICGELFMPDNCYTWCAGQMMHLKEVPQYAFEDFWSQKPAAVKPIYKLLSYIIAPLSVCVFNNARTLAVYHDMRVLSTFRNAVNMLRDGKNMLIFPEKAETDNNIVYKFQDRFVDTAKLYYKTSGVELSFVPMYIAPKLRKMYVGDPIKYNSQNDIEYERERICSFLSKSITDIAVGLPKHTVVPYRNLPKDRYLTNKDITEVPE